MSGYWSTCTPDRAFAAWHLDCDHGKTEGLAHRDAEPGATVWVGFDGLEADELAALVDAQDERLRGAQPDRGLPRRRDPRAAGQPHAIGAGVLLVELQEPTDFSVMLEHERFGLDRSTPSSAAAPPLWRAWSATPLPPAGIAALRRRWTDTGVRSGPPAEAGGVLPGAGRPAGR